MYRALALAWSFAVLVAASPAGAGDTRLLTRVPQARMAVAMPGIGTVEALRLDAAALGDLRAQGDAVVAGFPLDAHRSVSLRLHRLDVFAGARLVSEDADGEHTVAPPDRTYFTGDVDGDPLSRVVLVAGPDQVHGFVATAGDVFVVAPTTGGLHRSWALSTVDLARHPAPADYCRNDLHAGALDVVAAARSLSTLPPVASIGTTLRQVDLAIETDQELRAKFGSDAEALDWLGTLVAAANVIYERDTGVRLRVSYLRLWNTTDPWTTDDTLSSLYQVQAWWTDPSHNMDAIAGPRAAVHFVSGKDVTGGVAWINGVCEHDYGFAVSQVFGAFDLADPTQIWDVEVFTHELGHTLGSPHTHCYEPPIDRCYNAEPGCYSGPVVPDSNGTIMSYCHLNSGGLANIHLVFGDRVSAVIRDTVASATCLTTIVDSCGNGVIDAGETCDDGNTVSGDGCSATCQRETVCGDGVTEGLEQCDDGNRIAGDGCSPRCAFEVCGNGILDPGETCDDGNTTAGDGCSASCQREPRCGDGVLDPGEACDDGNTTAGDGCSPVCTVEPCRVTTSLQSTWQPAQLSWTHTAHGDRLKLRARFGVPSASGTPDPRGAGVDLLVADGAGVPRLTIPLPGGGWHGRSSQARWRSGGSTASLRVRDLPGGVSRDVDVRVAARGTWSLAAGDLPLIATVVLGDETAGHAGACGRFAWGSGRCAAANGGRRLVCR